MVSGTERLIPPDCEFCVEFTNISASRFHNIYHGCPQSRIVMRHSGIVALPTLGQLFRGSFLVLPTRHFETAADLPASLRDPLCNVIAAIEERIGSFGSTLLFEHGARTVAQGGCGIYHAHIHVVPVPRDIRVCRILPEPSTVPPDLVSCLDRLAGAESYVWARDARGEFRSIANPTEKLPVRSSQYFRRFLATEFDLPTPWDWRSYTWREDALLEALELCADPHVFVG